MSFLFGGKKQEQPAMTQGPGETPRETEPPARSFFPVPAQSAETLLRDMASRREDILERLPGPSREIDQARLSRIETLAHLATAPWLTPAGLAISVLPKAFKADVRRKISGAAELLHRNISSLVNDCLVGVKALVEYREDRALLERKAREILNKYQMEYDQARVVEELEKFLVDGLCGEVVDLGMDTLVAFTVAMDRILGASQSSLPVSLMPNTVKMRLGFVTD